MINWKLRFQNKTTLISLIVIVISFIYKLLDLIGVIPPFPQDQLVDVIGLLVDILCAFGIVTDPTTAGIQDSNRAMGYEQPNNDRKDAAE